MASTGLPSSFYCTPKADLKKPIDTSNLKGKNVIVTGGANGLGEGCVKAFAEAGAYVSIFDINEERGNAVAEELTNKGHHVQFLKTDTTSYASQLSSFKSAISFPPTPTLDIVLTCAGLPGSTISKWLSTATSTASDPAPPSTSVLAVNLTGLYYSAHLALYFFKKTATPADKASKQLIFVSSLASYLSLSNLTDYTASKQGVRGLWKALRHSTAILGPRDAAPPFRTNLICPHFVRTRMTAELEPWIAGMGFRMCAVEDVAAGVLRVAADESVYGRAVAVAGGEGMGGVRFDLCDDWEGADGGREILGAVRGGPLKGMERMSVPGLEEGGVQGKNPLKDL